MKAVEEKAFAQGVSAEALMDEAGWQIAAALEQFHPVPSHLLVFYGKGHNGGDALVAARHLAERGWSIELEAPWPPEALAPLTRRKLDALLATPFFFGSGRGERRRPPAVVLDGLLGIGASGGPLREPLRTAVEKIAALRARALIVAIDLPTGLNGDTGQPGSPTVEADVTLTIGLPKRGLLADEATRYVGRLALLDLPQLREQAGEERAETLATPRELAPLRWRRPFETHKGEAGRVSLLAGSRGLSGAALMTSLAAVRGGAGLVTLWVPEELYPIVAPSLAPEVMARPIRDYREALDAPADLIATGPGLGSEAWGRHRDGLRTVMESFEGPMVLDADALNLIAREDEPLRHAGPRLLTPHPGEMARLFPQGRSLPRKEQALAFLSAHDDRLTLLLKGARTLVAGQGDGQVRLSWNTTGNPGMASGGMGDILTGLIAALAVRRLSLFDAARLGAWIAGRAAEAAIAHGWRTHETLCASDLPEFFAPAFEALRGESF